MDGFVTIEQIDGFAALEDIRRCEVRGSLVLTIRAGADLVLTSPGGEVIVIRFQGKHGNGARLLVQAPRTVKITPPN